MVYCWACGRKVDRERAIVFYTEDGKRAYVHAHMVAWGISNPHLDTKVFTPGIKHSECYLKAKQENTLFRENPTEVKEAEAHKGTLY